MAGPNRTSPGPLVAPIVVANIVRDYVEQQKAASAERGTSRLDEAGHLVLLRDANTLAGLGEE